MEAQAPLWGATDQIDRLAELTASRSQASKDAPLRRDVRSLGFLLGRVLREQAGPKLFGTVERLRRLLIEHREQAANAGCDRATLLLKQALATVAALDLE